jgi:hypothetical protein
MPIQVYVIQFPLGLVSIVCLMEGVLVVLVNFCGYSLELKICFIINHSFSLFSFCSE